MTRARSGTLATLSLLAALLSTPAAAEPGRQPVAPDAYAAFCMGICCAESRDPEGAVRWFEKALAADPASHETHLWIALVCDEQLQHHVKARKHFEKAIELAPESFQPRRGFARLLLRDGQTKEGRDQMLLALRSPEAKASPELTAQAHAELAADAELRRDWPAAAESYALAAQLAPNPAFFLLRLSHTYQRTGDYEKAVDALRQVATHVPNYDRVHRELSDLYIAMGKWREAYEELDAWMKHRSGPGEQTHLLRQAADLAERAALIDTARSLREKVLLRLLERYTPGTAPPQLCEDIAATLEILKRPNDAEPYLRRAVAAAADAAKPPLRLKLAQLYRRLRLFPKAAAELAECVRSVEPRTSIRYRTELCSVLESAAQFDDAEAALKPILDIPGCKAVAHAELGLFHQRRGNYDKAVQHLLEAVKLAETDAAVRFRIQLSSVYADAGRHRDAEQLLIETHRMFPANASVNNALGWFYAERGVELQKALDLVQSALKTSPDNPYFLDSLAWVYFKQGRSKDALEQLLKAAALAQDGSISDHLGDVYLQLGRPDKAREHWNRSLELNPAIKGVREKVQKLGNPRN